MKDKIVIWGRNEEDKKVLLAIELKEKENQVDIHVFPETIVTENFVNELMNSWKNGKEVLFPSGFSTINRPLSITDDLLPEQLKVERTDLITRAKAEWHFIVLSSKLYELYSTELADIKEKVEKLDSYSNGVWEEMKGFWSKVQDQVRERNLFREHANSLRETTNELFDRLKALRKDMDSKFREESKKQANFFNEKLGEIKEKIESGKGLQPLFDELKQLQSKFSGLKFSQDDRTKVWNKLDAAFKLLKEKKYGKGGGSGNNNALTRLENRYEGLLKAIDRMKNSIERDLRDKNNQNSRANNAFGQLEAQLRQARIMMIDERISSKQAKLKDMLKTKAELENKISKEKARQEKAAQQEEIRKKTEAKKEEIKANITPDTPKLDPEEAEKLEEAAKAIKAAKSRARKKKEEAPRITSAEVKIEDTLTEHIVIDKTILGETEANTESAIDVDPQANANEENTIEDVIDKVEDVIEDVVDKVKDVAEAALDKIEDFVDKISGEEEE